MKHDVEFTSFYFFTHMLDIVGIEELSGLFITSSIEQFHYTCLNVVVATQKN
jgi:hypothetical protein